MTKDEWRRGLEDEARYWRDVIRTGGPFPEDWRARLDPTRTLPAYLAALVPPGGSVLDVGAGPLTCLGSAGGHTLRAVDVLGERYATELAAVGVVPIVPTEQCDAERLVETVGREAFDLVYSRNAIDHAWDALACIRAMVATCKVGGYVVLEHREREAETQGGKGVHGWNFFEDEVTIRLQRRGEPSFDLLAAIGNVNLALGIAFHDGWMRWTLRKKASATRIPRRLSQIWTGPRDPPARLMRTWEKLYTAAGWEYRLFGNTGGAPWAYQREIDLQSELNGKADVMRYEILFRYGGVCVDADSEALAVIPDDLLDAEAFAAWENEAKLPGMVATGTIGAAPRAAVLHDVLHRIRCRSWGDPATWAKLPAWRSVGPEVWTETVREHPEVAIHPAAYFIPEHYSKVPPAPADRGPFARQYWGSTMLSPHYGYAGLT